MNPVDRALLAIANADNFTLRRCLDAAERMRDTAAAHVIRAELASRGVA